MKKGKNQQALSCFFLHSTSVVTVDSYIFLREKKKSNQSVSSTLSGKNPTHITKITRPIPRPLRAQPKLNNNLELIPHQNLLRAALVDFLGLAVDEDGQRGGAVGGEEGDAY
jgi:hypothetical protein